MSVGNFHVSDDHLEYYAMGRLEPLAAENLEEHLLVCESCQIRLDETDTYVRAVSSALRRSHRRESVREGLLARIFPQGIFTPAFAGALALVAVVLGVTTQLQRFRPDSSADVVTVRLEAMKGDTENSVADRPLTLLLDGRGLPGASSYRLQIVNQSGRTVWESAAAARQETLRGSIGKRLGSGRYFVRVFGDGAEPLREFALRVK